MPGMNRGSDQFYGEISQISYTKFARMAARGPPDSPCDATKRMSGPGVQTNGITVAANTSIVPGCMTIKKTLRCKGPEYEKDQEAIVRLSIGGGSSRPRATPPRLRARARPWSGWPKVPAPRIPSRSTGPAASKHGGLGRGCRGRAASRRDRPFP